MWLLSRGSQQTEKTPSKTPHVKRQARLPLPPPHSLLWAQGENPNSHLMAKDRKLRVTGRGAERACDPQGPCELWNQHQQYLSPGFLLSEDEKPRLLLSVVAGLAGTPLQDRP